MEQGYITDQELLNLIEDVEEHAMLKAPGYLKQQMLQEIRQMEQSQKTTVVKNVRYHIRKQMILYEIKTISGIAAALIILFLMPISAQSQQNMTKEEYYAQQEQSATSGLNKVTEGILEHVNIITERVWNLPKKQDALENDNQKQEPMKEE
ncbi:MAG: hypothetical protein J6K43_05140 [Lachnospiraceae bacterium]|nr:hypothetical protein [Lachnospiraceae bacterium]